MCINELVEGLSMEVTARAGCGVVHKYYVNPVM